jgi:1-pyrroline-5-carboxylate dehydrogenase
MSHGFFNVPKPCNEPVLSYAPGTKERSEVKAMLSQMRGQLVDIPMFIDGQEIRTNNKREIRVPHDHKHLLGHYHLGDRSHVLKAIDAALEARKKWKDLPWQHRAGIFLKAADLISGKYRAKINAATMLCQSKNIFQAEIDAACEFADFLRFNVYYMTEIYKEQPISAPGTWNYLEQRPLEGFITILLLLSFVFEPFRHIHFSNYEIRC